MKELFGRLRPHALAPVASATEEPTIDLRSLPGSSDRAQVDEEVVTPSAQPGVQAIEATTQTWKKEHLVAAYALIWVVAFVTALEQGMTAVFQPYVTSHFGLHSLTSTTQVLPAIVGGLTRLPLAKLIDVWGRPQGFAIMIGFLTLGLAMMAACNNAKTFTAAQVFYWIGQMAWTTS